MRRGPRRMRSGIPLLARGEPPLGRDVARPPLRPGRRLLDRLPRPRHRRRAARTEPRPPAVVGVDGCPRGPRGGVPRRGGPPVPRPDGRLPPRGRGPRRDGPLAPDPGDRAGPAARGWPRALRGRRPPPRVRLARGGRRPPVPPPSLRRPVRVRRDAPRDLPGFRDVDDLRPRADRVPEPPRRPPRVPSLPLRPPRPPPPPRASAVSGVLGDVVGGAALRAAAGLLNILAVLGFLGSTVAARRAGARESTSAAGR